MISAVPGRRKILITGVSQGSEHWQEKQKSSRRTVQDPFIRLKKLKGGEPSRDAFNINSLLNPPFLRKTEKRKVKSREESRGGAANVKIYRGGLNAQPPKTSQL